MKYQRFEELPVWGTAIELAAQTYVMTSTGCLKGHPGLRDQIERAAVSVSNNIAEGFERGTHEELITFLYIARGSAGEVRSMLCLLGRLPGIDLRDSDIEHLNSLAVSSSRQLGAWIESLKNSESKGPRYQNDSTRRVAEEKQRRDAFLSRLEGIRNGVGPKVAQDALEKPPPG